VELVIKRKNEIAIQVIVVFVMYIYEFFDRENNPAFNRKSLY